MEVNMSNNKKAIEDLYEKEDGIRCIYGKKEIYIPKVLNKETRYKKTKEYTM
jgi:hypothetical protein